MFVGFVDEFVTDWTLAGRQASTARTYRRYLLQFADRFGEHMSAANAKVWLAEASHETARGRVKALRSFARWSALNDGPDWSWALRLRVPVQRHVPQPTVTAAEHELWVRRAESPRDRLLFELLWCTGMRLSELARVAPSDVNAAEGWIVVPQSKSGKPRLVPLSVDACRMLRRFTPVSEVSLLGWSAAGIQSRLRRLGAPRAHAWRRGWTVESLRRGVSQISVQQAAGWSSGAMVAVYTSALAQELAVDEFRRVRRERGR